MTVTYGFYDSLSGDRKYNALQMSRMFEGIVTDGIFSSIGTALAVTANAGTMNVSVGIGRCWFNFTWTLNDASLLLTVDPSEAVLNRIDTVIVEVNSDTAVRANSIKILKGTPGATPVAPTLAATSTLHQYALANIYVGAGVTSISSGNITNRIGLAGGAPFATGILQVNDPTANGLQTQVDNLKSGWIPASGTWAYSSADAPTFAIGISADLTSVLTLGDRIKLNQTTDKFFIVTKIGTYSGGTMILTVYGGTDYTLANAAISNPCFSHAKAPFGFPMNPEKWTVTVSDTTTRSQATPTNGTWYNPGSIKITIPIGVWNVLWQSSIQALSGTATTITAFGTLSTANNTESDPDFTCFSAMVGAAGYSMYSMITRQKCLNLTTKTDYYMNIKTDQNNMASIAFVNAASRQITKAICSYL